MPHHIRGSAFKTTRAETRSFTARMRANRIGCTPWEWELVETVAEAMEGPRRHFKGKHKDRIAARFPGETAEQIIAQATLPEPDEDGNPRRIPVRRQCHLLDLAAHLNEERAFGGDPGNAEDAA